MDLDLRARPGRSGRRWPRPAAGLLLAAALSFMALAWVGGNPPGMSVDEPAHYRKAVGLAHLDVIGEPAGYLKVPANTPSMLAWLNRTSRAVTVPPGVQGCHAFRLPVGGRCPRLPPSVVDRPLRADQEVTYVGTYPPFVYALPAVPMRVAEAFGGDTEALLMVGRVALALLCLALVIGAGYLLGDDGRGVGSTRLAGVNDLAHLAGLARLAGLALAVSPMVVFLMAELAASGPEVAASISLLAAAFALTSGAGPARPAVAWTALAASAVVLAGTRSVGPVWLAVLAAIVVVLRGPRLVLAVVRAHRRAAKVTAALAAAATAATVVWRVVVEPKPPLDASTVASGIWPGLRQVPAVLAHAVGSFGWFDVDLPWPLYAVWGALVGGLVVLALVVGSTGERRALAGLLVLEVVGAVAFYAAVIRPTSVAFKMQGRYVLPLLVALPLVAGEIVGGHSDRVASVLRSRASQVLAGGIGAAATVHALAWVANARYYQHSAVFGREYPARWDPWGGWLVWGVVAGCGVALAWLAVVSASRVERVADP
ncbi:MAG TPA: DUF2142 domain-containing protein [Acidimicrobiales bacterium]|nr:DUF2142 domain-containing protein [Acidimicrobiales bacterium]